MKLCLIVCLDAPALMIASEGKTSCNLAQEKHQGRDIFNLCNCVTG